EFEKEVSVVAARSQSGEFVDYVVIENSHRNHILDVSFAPAAVSREIYRRAVEITKGIAETFDYVGTLCVEFFLTANGNLLVNEIAPR
ncbi:ATP-grasp domain-containing protein, partial [Escherichia coli]|nr:ATP-grasp domain-containing protein [Escherichia coli]